MLVVKGLPAHGAAGRRTGVSEPVSWLSAAMSDLERLHTEAHEHGEALLAYLIDLALQEAKDAKDLKRGPAETHTGEPAGESSAHSLEQLKDQ
jgi:hypothetical protein